MTQTIYFLFPIYIHTYLNISEVEPEKKSVISKVKFVCDLIDDSIPKPLFQNYNSF
jgi:hypothetical protein